MKKKKKQGRPSAPKISLKEIFSALKKRIVEEFGDKADEIGISSIKIDFSIDPTKTIEKDLEISIRHSGHIDMELNLSSALNK